MLVWLAYCDFCGGVLYSVMGIWFVGFVWCGFGCFGVWVVGFLGFWVCRFGVCLFGLFYVDGRMCFD